MEISLMVKSNYRTYGWLLAAALLMPISLGLACAAASSDAQQPERHVIGPIGNATFEQLVIHSNVILVGAVSDIVVKKADNGKEYRLVTLTVEQVIKGGSTGQAVVRVPGGNEDSGADIVKLAKGERVLLLLDSGTGSLTIDGLSGGKFTIDSDNNIDGKPLDGFINEIKNILANEK